MDCQDLIDALIGIEAAINSLELIQGDILVQATAQASSGDAIAIASSELNALMVSQSQAIALAQSWSQSIAVATASTKVYNDVQILLPYFDPVEPPALNPVLADGGFDGNVVPETANDEFCDRATWVVDFAIGWIEYLVTSRVTAFSTAVLSTVTGFLGSKLALIAGSLPHPIARVAALSGAFIVLLASGITHDDLLQMVDDLKFNRSYLICILYNETRNYTPTQLARDNFLQVVGSISQIALPLVAAIVDASLIGMMYLRFATEDFPAADLNVCDSCNE